jgi:hypothetical protein
MKRTGALIIVIPFNRLPYALLCPHSYIVGRFGPVVWTKTVRLNRPIRTRPQ